MSGNFENIKDFEELVIALNGRLPTQEEIQTARRYLECLNTFRPVPQEPVTERELLMFCSSWLSLIDKLGGGDPLKAARKHAEIMLGLHQAMELSTSDHSSVCH